MNGGGIVSVSADEINRLNKSIHDNNVEINKIQKDIEKLSNYMMKLKAVLKKMEELSLERKRKINCLTGLFDIPIKLNVFSSMMDSTSSVRYHNAIADMSSSIKKIDNKISELQKKIQYLRNQNDTFTSQVSTLKHTEDGV